MNPRTPLLISVCTDLEVFAEALVQLGREVGYTPILLRPDSLGAEARALALLVAHHTQGKLWELLDGDSERTSLQRRARVTWSQQRGDRSYAVTQQQSVLPQSSWVCGSWDAWGVAFRRHRLGGLYRGLAGAGPQLGADPQLVRCVGNVYSHAAVFLPPGSGCPACELRTDVAHQLRQEDARSFGSPGPTRLERAGMQTMGPLTGAGEPA